MSGGRLICNLSTVYSNHPPSHQPWAGYVYLCYIISVRSAHSSYCTSFGSLASVLLLPSLKSNEFKLGILPLQLSFQLVSSGFGRIASGLRHFRMRVSLAINNAGPGARLVRKRVVLCSTTSAPSQPYPNQGYHMKGQMVVPSLLLQRFRDTTGPLDYSSPRKVVSIHGNWRASGVMSIVVRYQQTVKADQRKLCH
jgi:hypothetical protein